MTPKKSINYDITPVMKYTFLLKLCGGWCGGNFSVEAFDYDEAVEKATHIAKTAIKGFPSGLTIPFEFELIETNGHIVFERELRRILGEKYTPDEIDIFFDEENYKIFLMYHSRNNSTPVLSVNPDDMIYIKGEDCELKNFLITLADKYGCGYQNLDSLD